MARSSPHRFFVEVPMEQIQICENKYHRLVGQFPEVPTFEEVDTKLLYQSDDAPFHVTLEVATVGETSQNGLVYDEELVSRIEEGLHGGSGIRGHTKDEDLSYVFPVDDVYWIGTLREGKRLWAKGYIPPGKTRDNVRRRKANSQGLGTSIFGKAARETVGKNTYKAKDFKLERLDLGSPHQISRRSAGNFVITSEFNNENTEAEMPNEITSLSDVPQHLREQIIQDAQVRADAARVGELQTQIGELNTQLAEQRQYGQIVAEIRTMIGADADVVNIMREYHTAMTRLTSLLGVENANVTVRVEELHGQVRELAAREFQSKVTSTVAEYTNWQVNDENRAKVETIRKGFKNRLLSALGGKLDTLAETAKSIWDDEYKVLAEALVQQIAGPGAVVTGKPNPTTSGALLSDAEVAALASRYAPAK